MQTKVCSKCCEEKFIDSYSKQKKGKYGVASVCKSCKKQYDQEYYQENKGRIKQYSKKYYQENKDRVRNYNKQYCQENRERVRNLKKQYYQENKEYYQEYKKQYYQENKERLNSVLRERRRNDPQFKLSRLIRERLKDLVRSGRAKKHCGYNEYVGCTPEELVKHIEAQFHKCPSTGEDMTWDNHGEWHIDHIRPLASFDLTKEEDFMQANHYTNLQPLWAEENLSKGANWDEE